ncbi:MAG: segregation/condensation protein A [Clostridiales bacterium]|nr:segregation/condensation protein A [Clostridiales bacterium]
MSYQLRLPVFEGPFDLLLHLIEKNQVDIYDIPIAEITRQYLEYLRAMEELDLEVASGFLLMAAHLLAIKSRMLVPRPKTQNEEAEELVDEREELVHDLLEYMRFKKAAVFLFESGKAESKYFDRPIDESLYLQLLSRQNPLDGKTLADLTAAFQSVLARAAGLPPVMEIVREELTVDEKMREIFSLLSQKPEGLVFEEIFSKSSSRAAVVVTFLALLELMHRAVVRVEQGEAFGEIYLYAWCLENYETAAGSQGSGPI